MEKISLDFGKNLAINDEEPSPTVLSSPSKSPSDKKIYKVIRLANNLTALLASDGPDLYREEDLNTDVLDSQSIINDKTSKICSSDSVLHENDPDSDSAAVEEENCSTSSGEMKNDRFAACAISVEVGSFSDPNAIPGLAHFLEHMLFMGSEKYPKENHFAEFTEKHGGWSNAYTADEYTTFYFACHVRYLFETLDVFSQFFISPLTSRDSMVREREAVDSEFNLRTSSDSVRFRQLSRSFASDENPAGKFTDGNLKTLKDDVSEDELYQSMRSFYQRHYSANLMTLAIIAKLPIDTLEKYVSQCFSAVPDRQVALPEFDITKPLFVKEKYHRMYYVTTIQNVNQVTLSWQMPPIQARRTKLISWLVRHESKGGLLSYLKSKLWAVSLCGGIQESNSLYSVFGITIVLTEEGFAHHLAEVIAATFSYLKLVRAELPQRRFYDELRMLNDLKFKFQEETDTSTFVTQAVENMHRYPAQDYFTGPYLFVEYNADEVTQLFLENITPESVNIIVQAKEFHPHHSVVMDQVEPWYKTKYSSVSFTDEQLSTWRDIEPYPEYKLPVDNPFISNDFSLLSETSHFVSTEYPIRIQNDEFMEVWHKLDTVFKLPMAYIGLHFLSPVVKNTKSSWLMLNLYLELIDYVLQEDTYMASLARLNYYIDITYDGISVTFNGFNHKLPTLLTTVIERMKNFAQYLTDELLDNLKTELKKGYRCGLLDNDYLIETLRDLISVEPCYDPSQLYDTVSHVRANDLIAFMDNFFSNSFVQCLVQGNISTEGAISVSNNVRRIFNSKPGQKVDLPRIRMRRIPIGQKCLLVKSFNELERNSITSNYYQWGRANIMQSIKLQILVKLMTEKMFNELRTKQQLGYSVGSWTDRSFGVLGFFIEVCSIASKFDTSYVEERISEFLQEFWRSLDAFEEDEFLKEREALIKDKSMAFDNLNEEAAFNFAEIIFKEYLFDRCIKDIECLRSVSLDDIKDTMSSIMTEGSDRNRRITIQLIGNNKDDDVELNETPLDERKFEFRFLKGEKKLDDYYIEDLDDFKSNLFLYPESKIMHGEVPSEPL